MQNKLTYTIGEEKEGKKLINFLKSGGLNISTRLCRKLMRGGYITINGERAINSDILKRGDIVDILLETNDTQDVEPVDIPIDIIYEDMDLLIVNKPPFMVVHPTKSHQLDTLANGVTNYFKNTKQRCIVRLVNRLDRDTSGLVIIAKSQYAHQQMAKKLQENMIKKFYIAIVEGEITGGGTIDLPIDRPSEDSMKREVIAGGQRAVTHYEAIASSKDMSALLIRLETGKTHQIRVHMSAIGHPIIGDTLYGRESPSINRQALHAFRLKFKSIRGEEEMTIESPIPSDMQKLLDSISELIKLKLNIETSGGDSTPTKQKVES